MSGNHKGGFGEPMSGFDDQGNSLTMSFGWGSRDGETLLADGKDQSEYEFKYHEGQEMGRTIMLRTGISITAQDIN